MILSVIIVNYRVPYFLELCLHSVRKTLEGLGAGLSADPDPDRQAEIIVVDNHSADGSVELLRPLFPDAHWLVNPQNTGFARASNVGLRQARGKYILFLNPDTVLPEDFAAKILAFYRSIPQ